MKLRKFYSLLNRLNRTRGRNIRNSAKPLPIYPVRKHRVDTETKELLERIRATSGQAAAVPPSRVMNSRRLMGFVLGLRTAPYHTVERELCFAAQRHRPFMSELGQNRLLGRRR